MNPTWRARLGRLTRIGAVAAVAVFAGIQLVPYGRAHDNPPVTAEAPWPDAATRELARGACYDCHSNETDWPWYSWIAPMSWLVQRDVEDGRDELNFSAWDADEADDAAEIVAEGDMPPRRYQLLHPAARLSDAERGQLVAALQQMANDEDDRTDDDRSGPNRGPG